MAKTKIDTIYDTIKQLKSLNMPIPSELLKKKEEEEARMVDELIESTRVKLETMTLSSLFGVSKYVSIKIHYDKDSGVKITHYTSDKPIES